MIDLDFAKRVKLTVTLTVSLTMEEQIAEQKQNLCLNDLHMHPIQFLLLLLQPLHSKHAKVARSKYSFPMQVHHFQFDDT